MAMHKNLYLTFGLFVVLAVAVPLAWAQAEQQILARDPSGDIVPIRVDESGNLITSTSSTTPSGAASGTHGACTNTTMNVGTTGTACPPAQRADRVTIMIQLVQAGESINITTDGTTTATATDGMNVTSSGTYNDTLAGTIAPSCRCTVATCSVRITECP